MQYQMASNQKLTNSGTVTGHAPVSSNNFEVQIINGLAHRIHRVIVHRFTLGDVDDIEIYAAQPIWEWQQTDQGKWVMAHAIEEPEWHRQTDYVSFNYHFIITAKLIGRDYTFWAMKWGNK